MEPAIKKTIIEFNGLPGCGKSTISRRLECQLGSLSKYKLHKKKGAAKYKKRLLFDPHVWNILLLSLFHIHIFRLDKAKWNALYGLLILYKEYSDFLTSNDDFFLLDQGIEQKILSIYHNETLSNCSLVKALIKKFEGDRIGWVSINVDCPIEMIIPRITQRPDNGARVNRLSASLLTETLKVQEFNLKSIRHLFYSSNILKNNVCVNSEKNPDANATYIYNQIIY